MVYYLNELSIKNPYCADTKESAGELMQNFVEVCRKVAKIGFDQLRYEIKLKGICLSENYYIESWLKDNDVERELKDRFRGIVNQTPFLEENETLIDECLYEYNLDFREPIGLKLAYEKTTICVSFFTNEKWNTMTICLERLCENNDTTSKILVCHLANSIDFSNFKRVFEFNPKHGEGGKGEHSNQSKIYYRNNVVEIEEVEVLLNTAIEHPNKSKQFCNFDKKNNRFIVFLPHESEKNKYHGFHHENEPNKDPDRDLNNSQNGIPQSTQLFLKNRYK